MTIFEFFDLSKQCIEYDMLSFEIMPETDKSFIDTGTLRLKKKSRNQFTITGDFEQLQNIGPELEVRFSTSKNLQKYGFSFQSLRMLYHRGSWVVHIISITILQGFLPPYSHRKPKTNKNLFLQGLVKKF